jgi:hypothetical protein
VSPLELVVGENVKIPYQTQILFGVGVPCVVFGVVILAKQHCPQLVRIAEEYYPLVIVVIGLACLVWARFAWLADVAQSDEDKNRWPHFTSHEDDSKTFYGEAQDRLKNYTGKEPEVKQLGLELDTRMKLEDFLIKFREAEHAKIKVWGTIFVSGLVSLVVALLTLLGKATLR